MISKNLFFKLIKQDFKKRVWCPILIFITYFLTLEVFLVMTLERIQKYPKAYQFDSHTYVKDYFFGVGTMPFIAAVCLTAFLTAISGFAYLHSKSQVDAYHSLPVSRSQFFWARYLSGILQFFIPFVIHVLICAGIAASKGAFAADTVGSLVNFVGLQCIVFVLSYSVSVLAVGLTGNIIVSILGTGVLFGYSAIISMLEYLLSSRYFHTYVVYNRRMEFMLSDKIWCFSPLSMILKLYTRPNSVTMEAAEKAYQYDASYVWVLVAAALLYSLLAYIVFRKRESEAAGKSIAFRAAEPVIKTMTVIPAALFCGAFFNEFSSSEASDNWFLFGIAFSFVILCLLMEIIFRLDIRGAFMHKKQFLFNAVCTALIVVVFKYDMTGYDTYVPADSELQSCAVNIEELMTLTQNVQLNDYGVHFLSAGEYRMANMEIQGNPSAMELARKAAAEKLDYQIFDYNEVIERSQEYMEAMERQMGYRRISYGYKLLNGKTVYREYVVDLADEDTLRLVSDIFDSYDYKIGSTPIFNDGWSIAFDAVKCASNFKRKDIMLTPQMQSKLIEAYHKEYTKLTLDTVMNVVPVGTIDFTTPNRHDPTGREHLSYSGNMYVYPQFTETIALLREYGFDMEEKLTADDVESIVVRNVYDSALDEIHYYDLYYSPTSWNVSTSVTTSVSTKEDSAVEYTDKEQIQQILDSIVSDGFAWSLNSYANYFDERYTVHINSEVEGVTYSFHKFIEGRVPEFIQ